MMYPTVFDLHGQDRLLAWKQFRDQLETDHKPLQQVAELWAKAPLVESYMNSTDNSTWPGPWELIMQGRYDTLGIALGIYHSLSLTERFLDHDISIYETCENDTGWINHVVVVDHQYVLNWSYGEIEHMHCVTQQAQMSGVIFG